MDGKVHSIQKSSYYDKLSEYLTFMGRLKNIIKIYRLYIRKRHAYIIELYKKYD